MGSLYRSHGKMNCHSTMWTSGFVNNKGTDQPAHLRSLICAFVIGLLESIISKLAMCFQFQLML